MNAEKKGGGRLYRTELGDRDCEVIVIVFTEYLCCSTCLVTVTLSHFPWRLKPGHVFNQ